MPLYEYQCEKCTLIFELLVNKEEGSQTAECPKCTGFSKKKVSSFGLSIVGGSPNETIDKTIGRSAEQKWQSYSDGQSARRKDKEFKVVDAPRTPDGKYMPVMTLGSEKDRKLRKEYSQALQEHRTKQKEKLVNA